MLMSFMELAEKRYSVRKFDERPIPEEVLQTILRAGQLAPTACNLQPQRVLVLQSQESLQKLAQCTRCTFGCKAALVVCYDQSISWKRRFDGQDSGWVDASIVIDQMMMAAAEQGVGSTWVMYFDPAALREQFAIPEQLVPVSMLVMGYPAQDAAPGPMHADRKPLTDTVFYEHF